MEQAQNQLAAYKSSIENECETLLQRQKDAEKITVDTKQTLNEISTKLDI